MKLIYENKKTTPANYGIGSSGGSTRFDVTGITYDDSGNLLSLKRDNRYGSLVDNLTYNYQSVANRLGSISDAANATSGDWDVEDYTFTYDANGNVISQSGKFSSILYTHRNLPSAFTTVSGPDVQALYDANGQRLFKELSNGDYEFYLKDGVTTLALL